MCVRLQVTMFGQYTSTPFQVEQVKVVYADGSVQITPDLSVRSATARVDEIQSIIGVPLVSKPATGLKLVSST